ncbi:hypothetical protein AB5J62_24460 [Amycolatopsis sp. cg5]|uniref:hypothetical protein n=1 Tax=Amycolatopsis sp. cg5 TaxID=3238802 RepID=UPI003526BF7A
MLRRKLPAILRRRRTAGDSPPQVGLVRAGHATVVHRAGEPARDATALALSLVEDVGYDVLVVDLPAGTGDTHWEALALCVAGSRLPVRLVPVGGFRTEAAAAALWLSDRLARPVLAPGGVASRCPGGGLFVDSGPNTGWFRFSPGQEPERTGKRFPAPSWESPAVVDRFAASGSGVAEPLPAGVWLRPEGDPRWIDAGRARLSRWLSCQPDVLTAVLGGHGLPELPLDFVEKWWDLLPAADRGKVRFVHYGQVESPGGQSAGHVIAERLGMTVVFYNGLPVGAPDRPDVLTIRADGSHGWSMFAQELAYRPGARAGEPPLPPELRAHRRPLAELKESTPGCYLYGPDVVLEVVPAGLWVRPLGVDDAEAMTVRSTVPDPAVQAVYYDVGDHESTGRLQRCAEEVLARLDASTRLSSQVLRAPNQADPAETSAKDSALPTSARLLGGAGQLMPDMAERTEALAPAEPADTSGERTEALRSPGPLAVRAQETPKSAADAREPAVGLAAERAWIRATYEEEFSAVADVMPAAFAGILADGSGDELLADFAAVRMYLAGGAGDLDSRLRAAMPGPHVAFARCVRSGLARLPVYRGATVATLTPPEALWDFLADAPILTEWGFLTMLSKPSVPSAGDTDVLLWSMTGRLTAALEPKDVQVANRVIFLPGTTFRIVDAIKPAGDSRGTILVRESSSAELNGAGDGVDTGAALDELTRTSLRRAGLRWSAGSSDAGSRAASGGWANRVPGVV